jgi:regulation of enolase protein 1 (concanavalin A-like superfamily)
MELAVDEDLRHWLTSDRPTPTIDELAPLPPRMVAAPANDNLPSDWTATDIGGARKGGQEVDADGQITLYGSGGDIWGNRDQFRFVHQMVDGDFELETVVESVGRTHSSAKGGLMIRKSLDPDSPHVLLSIRPDGDPEYLHRDQMTGQTRSTNLRDKSRVWSGQDETVRLRLVRKGGQISGAYAYNKGPWKNAGTVTLQSLSGNVEIGLVACSHDNNTLVQVGFSEIIVVPLPSKSETD